MQLFLDSANVLDIKVIHDTGLLDGITTNPSLIVKQDMSFTKVVKEICDIVDDCVSVEVLATDVRGMLKEALELSEISSKTVIKIPLTKDGLVVVKELTRQKIRTNVTLCFSANQALLAAKSGATYISPFMGRANDYAAYGTELIQDIRQIYDNYDLSTQILVASIRSAGDVKYSALCGVDAVTLPVNVFHLLFEHPLTEIGLAKFVDDAKHIQW